MHEEPGADATLLTRACVALARISYNLCEQTTRPKHLVAAPDRGTGDAPDSKRKTLR